MCVCVCEWTGGRDSVVCGYVCRRWIGVEAIVLCWWTCKLCRYVPECKTLTGVIWDVKKGQILQGDRLLPKGK